LPKENAEHASHLEVAVASKNYQAPDWNEIRIFNVPQQLRHAWKECDRLRALKHSPESHAPHIWREYLESLLRYEQLMCARETNASETMRTRLRNLKTRIEGEKLLKLPSRFNSLTMLLALGGSTPQSPATIKEIDQAIESGMLEKKLAEWFQKKQKRETLRIGFAKLLLNEMVRGRKPDDMQRVIGVLPKVLVSPEFAPRPAEAHFVAMMNEFREKNKNEALPSHEQLSNALEVRILAEKAAVGLGPEKRRDKNLPLYSEQVFPWIKSDIEKGDRDLNSRGVLPTVIVNWTDKHKLKTNYILKASKDIPPGLYTVWRKLGDRKLNVKSIKGEPKRLIDNLKGEILTYELERHEKAARDFEVIQIVNVYFRGHPFQTVTRMVSSPIPNQWAKLPGGCKDNPRGPDSR